MYNLRFAILLNVSNIGVYASKFLENSMVSTQI